MYPKTGYKFTQYQTLLKRLKLNAQTKIKQFNNYVRFHTVRKSLFIIQRN